MNIWKSNNVVEGFIENSLSNKKKIGQQITSSVSLNPLTFTGQTESPAPKRLKQFYEEAVYLSTASSNSF